MSFPFPGHLTAAGCARSVCDMSDGLRRTQGAALHAHIAINAAQLARFGSPLGNHRRAAGDRAAAQANPNWCTSLLITLGYLA